MCAAAHGVGDDERASPQRPGAGAGASQRGPHRWRYFDLMYNTRVPFGYQSPSCGVSSYAIVSKIFFLRGNVYIYKCVELN